MPWVIVESEDDRYCVHKENADGTLGELVKCHPTEGEAENHRRALYANVEEAAAKYWSMAVKAVGDWELEIRAVPYGRDREIQTFSANTEYMESEFKTPLIVYQHGIKPGAATKGIAGLNSGESWESRPVVIGKSISVEKRSDGVYVRAVLDKTKELARRVWEAAKKGMAVASSDSIAHLSRMRIDGKEMMYDKDRPGDITVWPLAGVSLWDAADDNFRPASQRAIALPVMKAIYREAGLDFPDLDTHGADQAAEMARQRAKVLERAAKILSKHNVQEK